MWVVGRLCFFRVFVSDFGLVIVARMVSWFWFHFVFTHRFLLPFCILLPLLARIMLYASLSPASLYFAAPLGAAFKFRFLRLFFCGLF